MAATFDPANKIVQLDAFTVSVNELWTDWADWVVLSDNSKYLPAFDQLGGEAPVALYLYLENGWRIRLMEADGLTTITGNILVREGGNPIVATLGNWNSVVKFEAPLAAQAIAVASATVPALTAEQSAALLQVSTILKMMRNKMVTDPETGVLSVYDDDGVSLLYQADIFEDVSGLQAYRGQGVNRRDRLE